MDEARKRLGLYLSSIVLFILFYVIVVSMQASISKRLSCSVMNTENMTSHENGTVPAGMATLASLIDTIISVREGTYTPRRPGSGIKRFRCANRKSGVNASLKVKNSLKIATDHFRCWVCLVLFTDEGLRKKKGIVGRSSGAPLLVLMHP